MAFALKPDQPFDHPLTALRLALGLLAQLVVHPALLIGRTGGCRHGLRDGGDLTHLRRIVDPRSRPPIGSFHGWSAWTRASGGGL